MNSTHKTSETDGIGFQAVSGFKKSRRNLPHLQDAGHTYFITFRVKRGSLPERARRIVLGSCLYWQGTKCHVHACVVMPDHVHLLMTPQARDDGSGFFSLSEILYSIKSYSAHQINRLLGRTGALWQDESFDRLIRSETDLAGKWTYIRNNPVKKGLVESVEEYPYLYEESGVPQDAR